MAETNRKIGFSDRYAELASGDAPEAELIDQSKNVKFELNDI